METPPSRLHLFFRIRSLALAVQRLVACCPEGAGRVVTKEDLVWAMECVLSRAFSGRFGGGQNVSENH